MNTRIIEYILAIYEEKNLTRAAERLFITPSALNQQLKKLEQELKTPLFERQNQQMVPTGPGKIYLSGARAIMKIKHDTEKQIKYIKNSPSHQSIHLAFHYTFLPFFNNIIEPAFANVCPNTPLIAVPVRETSAKSVIQSRQADLGLLITQLPSTASMEYIPIRREEFHLAFPKKAPIDLSEITKNHNLSMLQKLSSFGYIQPPTDSFLYLNFDYYLQRAGIHPHIICQSSSMKDLRFLLNQQFACGLIPKSMIDSSDTFAHTPLIPSASYYLGIAYHKSLYITPEIRELILLFLRYFDREYENYDIINAFTS